MGWFKRAVEKVNPPYTPERHEQYLLSIMTYDWDAAHRPDFKYPNYPRVAQYVKQPNGDVYFRAGRWYIGKELWEHRVNNFLFPDAHHNYLPDSHVEVDVAGGQSWPRRAMLCTRCGDRRDKVSLFVDTAQINRDGWCVKG